jgi:hypothetical protein
LRPEDNRIYLLVSSREYILISARPNYISLFWRRSNLGATALSRCDITLRRRDHWFSASLFPFFPYLCLLPHIGVRRPLYFFDPNCNDICSAPQPRFEPFDCLSTLSRAIMNIDDKLHMAGFSNLTEPFSGCWLLFVPPREGSRLGTWVRLRLPT